MSWLFWRDRELMASWNDLRVILMHSTMASLHCRWIDIKRGVFTPKVVFPFIFSGFSIHLNRYSRYCSMSSPTSTSRVHEKGWGSGETPLVYRRRLLVHISMELKMRRCMEMFHTLDSVLIDFIFMTHPWVQKQDERLDMVEEKVETMAGWFNEMRMNGGIPSIGIERFILENHP